MPGLPNVSESLHSSRRALRRWAPLLVVATLAVPLAACSSGTSSAAGGDSGSSSGGTSLDGQCGDVPTMPANDPDGLVDGLDPTLQEAFNGFTDEVAVSAWADLGPMEAPVTVGFLQNDSGSTYAQAFAQAIDDSFNAAKSEGVVESLLVENPGGAGGQVTPAEQVRAYEQLVRNGADIIIAQPLSGDALTQVVDEAGAAGIPTVTMTGYVPSEYAINLTPNVYTSNAVPLAHALSDLIGGKGNAVIVQGIEGMTINTAAVEVAESIIALCPDVKLVGSPAGGFTDVGAKSALTTFLASHPEDIDLVYQVASMGAGVFSAFDDSGRDAPVVVDLLATAASLAWWDRLREEQDYTGIATTGGGSLAGEAIFEVALRVIKGEGPAINQFPWPDQLITEENVADYIVPGEGTTSVEEVLVPEGGVLYPSDYLDLFFNNPTP